MTPAITDTISWWAPFEALEVGQEFSTRGRTVTEADVVGFAQLTGDWHPQHADAQWSETSPFGERIAHGLFVLSLAGGLVPFDPGARGRAAARRRRRLQAPGQARRHAARDRQGARDHDVGEEAGLVAFAWNVVNQDERVVTRARVEVLWRRDGAAAEHDDAYAVNGFIPIPL
jgi:acyl dehydratase